MLQLLSTDFDGTIVNHDTKPAVVPEMIAALRELRAAGVKWAVNTGRTLGHMDDGLVREFALPVQPDYAIVDLREAPGPRWPGKIVDAGFFDEEWK